MSHASAPAGLVGACLAHPIGRVLALALALMATAAAQAGPVLDRVRASATVRVCIWPDYYGITYRNPRTEQLTGLDVDLAAALGQDLQASIETVDSSFATLIQDLNGGRCDVAMFAVAMLPQRMEQLAFSQPYLQSDIYGIATQSSRVVRAWSDIDQPGVQVAVQAGTFMEPVMAQSLKRATLVVVRPPATRERELESGRVDVFMSDYPYSRRLLDNADWARLIAPPTPFHMLPYGYAVRRGDPQWLAVIDDFVARIKRDGRLEAAARKHQLVPALAR